MTTIALLAFATLTASIFIADTTEGLATAINESGSLRMRSYRIASKLTHNTNDEKKHWQETYQLITEFEEHLHSTSLTNVLPDTANHPLRLAYERIRQRWKNKIQPLFDVYLDGIIGILPETSNAIDMSISEDAVSNIRNRYLIIVSDFVNDIDKLVSLLEEDAESKIQGLRKLQYFALALTTLLTSIVLILIYKRIHIPLKQLLTGAERASLRDFSFHINYTGKDELGKLGSAFNAMADDLSKIYNELEDRIQQKTADLEQSNQSLQLLYKTVNRLSEAETPQNTFSAILDDIQHISQIGHATICLYNDDENTSKFSSDLITQLHNRSDCQTYLASDKHTVQADTDNGQIVSLPINDMTQQYGLLIISTEEGRIIESWQQQLLQTIARHIGIAIKLSRQSVESRRLVLFEERGAIARELHDSLAQSLTYMKIQLSRLHALSKDAESEEAKIISDLRLGLNSAYRELRELLTTFRLKIDGKDFNEAIVKTVLEFNDRSETEIILINTISYLDLTPNEEIHVLQLIREALSNIVQHAQASMANVVIKAGDSGEIEISISDNGIGINGSISKTHHYGLNIMKERCKTLDGTFEIANNSDEGTRVLLRFTPGNKTPAIPLT